MACGSPVVVSDLPWVHGELDPATEVVVVPIDAKAVADAVVGLLEDPVGAAAIAARARALTAERHDVRLEMDRLATLIHALV
jgi:glycosyltransferase involved in cell wall biosynthesis